MSCSPFPSCSVRFCREDLKPWVVPGAAVGPRLAQHSLVGFGKQRRFGTPRIFVFSVPFLSLSLEGAAPSITGTAALQELQLVKIKALEDSRVISDGNRAPRPAASAEGPWKGPGTSHIWGHGMALALKGRGDSHGRTWQDQDTGESSSSSSGLGKIWGI